MGQAWQVMEVLWDTEWGSVAFWRRGYHSVQALVSRPKTTLELRVGLVLLKF